MMVNFLTFICHLDKPDFDVKPKESYTKTKGLTLTLPCSFKHFDGTPTWKHTDVNGVVQAITGTVDAKGYTITNIDSSYEGNYTCSASNDYGELSMKTTIPLVISE